VKVSSAKCPIFEVFTEGRFQELVMSYRHEIEPELEKYYYHLPIKKFYDRQPITEYLGTPATILGDFVIRFYSYESLKH
jgi:hypothetical protein